MYLPHSWSSVRSVTLILAVKIFATNIKGNEEFSRDVNVED